MEIFFAENAESVTGNKGGYGEFEDFFYAMRSGDDSDAEKKIEKTTPFFEIVRLGTSEVKSSIGYPKIERQEK